MTAKSLPHTNGDCNRTQQQLFPHRLPAPGFPQLFSQFLKAALHQSFDEDQSKALMAALWVENLGFAHSQGSHFP